MKAPTKSEIVEKFNQLIQEAVSREEIASWAQKWVIEDNPPQMNKAVWQALQFLVGVDLVSTDRPYLYSIDDFKCELEKILEHE